MIGFQDIPAIRFLVEPGPRTHTPTESWRFKQVSETDTLVTGPSGRTVRLRLLRVYPNGAKQIARVDDV